MNEFVLSAFGASLDRGIPFCRPVVAGEQTEGGRMEAGSKDGCHGCRNAHFSCRKRFSLVKGAGMKERHNTIVVASVLLLVAIQPVLADVTNGDFSADFTVNTDPALGWVVTTGTGAGPVDWVDWSIEPPAAFFLPDPDGVANNSTLSQIITVEPGFSVLSFYVLMEVGGMPEGPETDRFTALLGGVELYSLDSSDLYDAGVSSFEGTITRNVPSIFIGTGPVMLEFSLAHDNDINDPETTVVLDSVTLVPVPGAFVLGSLGLGLAGWRLRKRRPL